MNIRPAASSDIPALLALVRRYWHFEGIEGFTALRMELVLQRLLGDPRLGLIWVAESEGQLQGYLIAVLVLSVEHQGVMAEIDEFFVMPQARTRGVGGRLLAAAETALAARGCVRLQLQLGVGNAGGRAFYEHRGPPGQGTSSSTSPSQPVDERTPRRPDSSHRLRRTTLSALSLPTHALGLALLGLLGLASAHPGTPDVYQAAVEHQGRSSDDLKRDSLDHPVEVLRLAGIKPGMQVADYLAGDGYYSELLSYVVGPKGHVLLINNAAYDEWSENHWRDRLANGRLPNVEHRTVDVEHLGLPEHSLDAILLIKVYHDLYWVATEGPWPKIDPAVALNELARVVKPGGVLLLVDHSAKPGTGSAEAGRLHRIDEEYARSDFEKHGFRFVSKSDAVRRPDDPRDQITYKGPMVGKTDRFVMVFRKSR